MIKKCKINQIATIIICNKNTDLFDFIEDSGSLIYVIYFVFFICELIEIVPLHVDISILKATNKKLKSLNKCAISLNVLPVKESATNTPLQNQQRIIDR